MAHINFFRLRTDPNALVSDVSEHACSNDICCGEHPNSWVRVCHLKWCVIKQDAQKGCQMNSNDINLERISFYFWAHCRDLQPPPFERPPGPQQTPPLLVRAAMERALALTSEKSHLFQLIQVSRLQHQPSDHYLKSPSFAGLVSLY